MTRRFIFALTAIVLALTLCSCSIFRSVEDTPATGESSTVAEDTAKDTVENTSSDPNTDITTDTGTDTDIDTDKPSESTDDGRPVIPTREPDAPGTICIDAGHGYVDPGCSTDYLNGQYEREIVAEYSQVLKDALEAMGYRVIMLRDDDRYVTAAEIADAADKMGLSYMPDKLVDDRRFAAYNRTVWANVLHRETYIDMFISLHIDSFDSMESVRGTRIYYCSENPYSADSKKLCESLTQKIGEALPEQNTKYYAKNFADAFVVTKHTEMPSALIEIGFATNPTDAENILSEDWQTAFVNSVAAGIADYLG